MTRKGFSMSVNVNISENQKNVNPESNKKVNKNLLRQYNKRIDRSKAKYLNASQVAEILGVSYDSVTALARAGKIPHIRFGSQYRFSKSLVEMPANQQPKSSTTTTQQDSHEKEE